MSQTTWVTISRSAVTANLRLFRRLVAPTRVMPIVKSNAYGHGLIEIAKIVERQPIWGVGVANTSEGLLLRQHGFHKRILVLNWANDELDQAIREGLQLTVYDIRFAKLVQRCAKKLRKKVRIHLKYDSGTTRLGLFDREFIALVKKCATFSNLTIEGVFSHFAESESASQAYTRLQLKRFQAMLDQVARLGIRPTAHIACTAAAIGLPTARFDLARIGIGLYGLWPSENTKRIARNVLPIRPALSWHTRIVQVKTVPAGTPISYGRTFVTKRRSRIAVIPVGYWDGFDRKLSNQGNVVANGKVCPIRGRVCMNLTMIDVTGVPRVAPGTVVTLIGQQPSAPIFRPRAQGRVGAQARTGGRGVVTADDMARDSGTINYETVTRINPLIPRVIVS